MIFYLAVVLVGLRARRLIIVLLAALVLQIAGVMEVAYVGKASGLTTQIFVATLFIKVVLGWGAFWWATRQEKKFPLETARRRKNIASAITVSTIVLFIGVSLFLGIQDGQRKLRIAEERVLHQTKPDQLEFGEMIKSVVPVSGTSLSQTYKNLPADIWNVTYLRKSDVAEIYDAQIKTAQKPKWSMTFFDKGSSLEVDFNVPSDFREQDFLNEVKKSNFQAKEICVFNNGASEEYIVYSLTRQGKKDALAYLQNWCIPMGPNAGSCSTFISLYFYTAPEIPTASESACASFVKEQQPKIFQFFKAGRTPP